MVDQQRYPGLISVKFQIATYVYVRSPKENIRYATVQSSPELHDSKRQIRILKGTINDSRKIPDEIQIEDELFSL